MWTILQDYWRVYRRTEGARKVVFPWFGIERSVMIRRHKERSIGDRAQLDQLHPVPYRCPATVIMLVAGWCILWATAPAMARDFEWVGGSGSWSDPNNWAPHGVPQSPSDTATIATSNGQTQPFVIEVDFDPGQLGTILLGGFTLNNANATLQPSSFLDSISVLGGTANLLNGNLGTTATSQMQLGIQSGTMILAGDSNLTGAGTFIAKGPENTLVSLDGVLSPQQTLVVRGSGGQVHTPQPGQLYIANERFSNQGTIVLDSISFGTTLLQLGSGAGELVNTGTIQTTQSQGAGLHTVRGKLVNYGMLDLADEFAGQFAVQGRLIQPAAGTLRLEVADGTTVDSLNISGSTNLGGTLDLRFINQFVPTVGEPIMIFNSTDLIQGSFDRVGDLVQFLDYGIGVRIEYVGRSQRPLGPLMMGSTTSDSEVIIAAHDCGDANGDGGLLVDELDLFEILSNWNDSLNAGVLPDMNGDGIIGMADLNEVLTNYVEVANASAIPEPITAWSLLACSSLLIIKRP